MKSVQKKEPKRNFTVDAPSLVPQTSTLSMRHTHMCCTNKSTNLYQYLLPNFNDSLILSIVKSNTPIFKWNINLLLIKRDDFFSANVHNFSFYRLFREKNFTDPNICIQVALLFCRAGYWTSALPPYSGSGIHLHILLHLHIFGTVGPIFSMHYV